MNQVEIKKRQMEMCSRMLGLITLLVLSGILGDNGIAYIAAAAEGFGLFWTLTGSQLADTLGKMIWNRSSRGQYKNVSKIKRNILLIEGVTGLVGSALMLFCATFLAEHVLVVPYSVSLMVILAPVIFLRTISSVLLGYFQGEGTQLPTVATCFLRHILVLLFSLLFTRFFCAYGEKVSVLLRQEDFISMYGGMGVALAILLSELLLLILLLFVYRSSRAGRKKAEEGMRTTETFGHHVRVFYNGLFPRILVAILRLLPLWLGLVFFRKSFQDASALNDYGIFYGKYMVICGLIALPLGALLMGGAARTASCLRREEQRYARSHFVGGLHVGVAHSVFCSVLVAILAPYLARIFCGTDAALCEQMLRYGSFIILFSVLKNYFSELLNLTGNKYLYWVSLTVYDIVFVISLVLMLNAEDTGIMALVDAGLVATGVFVLVAGFLFSYRTGMRVEWLQSVAVPAGVACGVGLILLFVSKAIFPHLGNLVTVIVCVVIAVILYWGALLLLQNFREQELSYMPGGKTLHMIGRLLRLI